MPGPLIAGATNMLPGGKKESSMPPAVWVPAAAGVVGSIFQSRGQSRAANAQQQSTNQAMALERERMAEERRRYDQQYEMAMQQRRLRDQIARQILSQHGINIPGAAAAQARPGKTANYTGTGPSLADLSPSMAHPGVAPPTVAPAGGMASPMFDSQGGSPSTLMSAPNAPPPQAPLNGPPSSSMAGLTNWSDELWRRQ